MQAWTGGGPPGGGQASQEAGSWQNMGGKKSKVTDVRGSVVVLVVRSVFVLSLRDPVCLSDVICAYVQVERKRHIGNDIVTIVFQEGEEPSPAFKPSMIRSHFTRILGLCGRSSVAGGGSASLDPKCPSDRASLTDFHVFTVLRCSMLRPPVWDLFFPQRCALFACIPYAKGWINPQRILDF